MIFKNNKFNTNYLLKVVSEAEELWEKLESLNFLEKETFHF
jgi:hypothetical protein